MDNEFIILDIVNYDKKHTLSINESIVIRENEILQLCAFKIDKCFNLIDKINLFIKPFLYYDNIEIDSTIMGININLLNLLGLSYSEAYNIFIKFTENLKVYVYDINIYKIFIFNNKMHKIDFNIELLKNMNIVDDLFGVAKIQYDHELINKKKLEYKISNPMWNLYILYEILNTYSIK
jgi:hypothetical protein